MWITLSFIFVILTVACFYLWLKARKRIQELLPFAQIVPKSQEQAAKIILEAKEAVNPIQEEAQVLHAQAKQTLEVAKSNAQSLVNESVRKSEEIMLEAASQKKLILATANQEAEKLRSDGLNKLNEAKATAIKTLEYAQLQYSQLLLEAEQRAKEIAGDAYDALKRANELQSVTKAMQNIIDGYGYKYLVPTTSFLDELAEEYSFDQAGERLKLAREMTRKMCTSGNAAECDYVETNRKETAIRFVLDAFNGKVDSILSKTKNDNVGTLEQKIVDAFTIVNDEGKAFRNAKIRREYLDARLEELKWGAAVQELKLRAKEEQRILKEQIREEQKARKEFERSIKEAAKEEQTLQKAMEKVRAELEKTSEAQRAKYEEKLAELQIRLTQAEDKSRRAMSLAQQTKRGNVYVISNIGSLGENIFKVGMTRRLEPLERIKELGDASVPFDFDVHAMITSDDAPGLEYELHRVFLRNQVNKLNPRKEFFRVSLNAIQKAVEKLGIEANWTIEAAALQYRETLILEDEMRKDPTKEQQWLESQRKYQASIINIDDEAEEAAAMT